MDARGATVTGNPTFPILRDHDYEQVIGEVRDGVARFFGGIPESEMLDCGYRVLKRERRDGVTFIIEAEIVEFSINTLKVQRRDNR